MLQSDRVGYLSLKLGRLAQNSELRHVWLRPFNDQGLEVDAFPGLNAGVEPALVTITLPGERVKACQNKPHLPSVPDPDVTDWHVSPESFANHSEVSLGQGPCEELLHSREVEGSFRFHQLVRDGGDPQVLTEAQLTTCEPQDEFLSLPQRCYRLGAMLEYEITWEPIGHGLGRVVYSLPLAPCESVRVAVIDWRRQDEVSRDEDTSLVETLHHSQRRDRDIEETVRATLTERQIGGSFMGGFGASGSKGGKSSSFGGSGSMGGAVTGSRGSRRLAAETAQHIADEISQSSTALRRLKSTIVVQASQAEQEVLQTRTVANHNHCHALTVLYYEVVRHYRVRVRLVHKQDVVFVQYRSINDMQEPFDSPPVGDPGHIDDYVQRFSSRVVLRYRDVLKPILLDTLLFPCFEAIAKLYCAERAFLQTPPDIPAEDYDLETIEIRFTTGAVAAAEPIFVSIRPVRGEQEILLRPPDEYYNPGGNPPNRLNMGRDFDAHSEVILTLRPVTRGPGGSIIDKRVRWQNIDSIKLETVAAWGLTEVVARTQHGEHRWTMVERSDPADPIAHDFESENVLFLEVDRWGPRTPEETLTPAERCCVDGLIEHLNLNKTFYSRAIWISQDAEERARAFERYTFQVEGEEGSRLTDFIENRIVGVTGDYVAFPMTISQFADELVQVGEVISERIVTLPTRGLFAETKLSNCSACEERDITRYWDWTESPCPEPPEIAPVEAGGRAQDIVPETTPTTFPSPVVNIVNPPSAPDPTGLAAVLKLLGTPEIFRDMSAAEEVGALVRDLAKGSVSLAEAQQRAQDIDASSTGRTTGSSGTSSSAQSTPTDLHDRSTVVNRAIDQGESSGALSEDQASELRRRVLEEMITSFGGGGGSEYQYAHWTVPPGWSDRLPNMTNFPDRIVQAATNEYHYWHSNPARSGTPLCNLAWWEDDRDTHVTDRLRAYWDAVTYPHDLTPGETDNRVNSQQLTRTSPWSGAFISYIFSQCGIPSDSPDLWRLAELHYHYIKQTIHNRRNLYLHNPFWGCDVTAYRAEVGDLVGRCPLYDPETQDVYVHQYDDRDFGEGRSDDLKPRPFISYDDVDHPIRGRRGSHVDIVVHKDPDADPPYILAVGGNVECVRDERAASPRLQPEEIVNKSVGVRKIYLDSLGRIDPRSRWQILGTPPDPTAPWEQWGSAPVTWDGPQNEYFVIIKIRTAPNQIPSWISLGTA
jgi:hypothetical protein